jgi:hypothetical protein
VAGATLHLLARPQEGAVATYTVAEDTPVTLGEWVTALIEGYGLPVGVRVPWPGAGVLRPLLALADQQPLPRLLERAVKRLWETVGEAYGRQPLFQPSLADVSFSALIDERLADNSALKATGYELRYPDVRAGLGEVIAAYQKAGFLPKGRPSVQHAELGRPRLGSRFAESMQGSFTQPGGSAQRDIRFRVQVTSPGIHLPIFDHMWNLDGTVTAQGLAEGAPLQGTLEVAPLAKKRLIYELGFTGTGGKRYRLLGIKNVDYTHLAHSLTHMRIQIVDEHGALAGEGEMSFNLKRDLWSFIRSFGFRRLTPGRAAEEAAAAG